MTDANQGFLWLPLNEVSISIEEPWVVLEVAGKKMDFLIDMRATYSVWISHAGPLSSKTCSVNGADGKPCTHYFTRPLTRQFKQRLISHGFLVVPQCPIPLLACVLAPQLCPTLCNPTNCSPPGSSVHGILQARTLGWVTISFSRGSSQLRDGTRVSRIANSGSLAIF